jgi:hypothetical protein
MKSFALFDRVSVSPLGGWKTACRGVVVSEPEPVDTVRGPEYFYWVEFDEAQQAIDGEDTYRKAQILSCYLESERP